MPIIAKGYDGHSKAARAIDLEWGIGAVLSNYLTRRSQCPNPSVCEKVPGEAK